MIYLEAGMRSGRHSESANSAFWTSISIASAVPWSDARGDMMIRTVTHRLKKFAAPVRVLEAGEGPPVVLLHGNPDNADEWSGVIERLSADFRCVAPDLPGYGHSPRLPSEFRYRLPQQVRFLDMLLASCGLATAPVILVVHDIGGMMGVAWAAANLSRVRGMLITNTVAFEGFQWFEIARVWGARGMLGRLRAKLLMAAIGLGGGARFRTAFAQQNPQLPAGEIERMVQTFALNKAAKNATLVQFREMLRPGFFSGFDAMNRTINAKAPVHVLWGDGDPYLDTALSRRFGAAQVEVLPGVGHWPPIVAPDRVAAAVRALSSSRAMSV